MRSAELRPLQPFITAVAGYAQALARDTSSCRCVLTAAGRWGQPPAGCPQAVVYDASPPSGEGHPDSCRAIVHTVIRFHLSQLRMPVDHVTDPELDDAVDQLQGLCLRASGLTTDDFATGVQRALLSDRVSSS